MSHRSWEAMAPVASSGRTTLPAGSSLHIAKTRSARSALTKDSHPGFHGQFGAQRESPRPRAVTWGFAGAAGRNRTDDLLIASVPLQRTVSSEQHWHDAAWDCAHRSDLADRDRIPQRIPRLCPRPSARDSAFETKHHELVHRAPEVLRVHIALEHESNLA